MSDFLFGVAIGDARGVNPLGDDLLPWLVLALGGALAVGTAGALLRPSPPDKQVQGDLARPPLARSLVMIAVGLVAAVWGLASLLT